jgi:hypothetical protein
VPPNRMVIRIVSFFRYSGMSLPPVIPGRAEGPNPESGDEEDSLRDSGFASKSAVADLDTRLPNSGKPEFGARPGMTPMEEFRSA